MIVFLMDYFDPCTTMQAWTAWLLVVISISIIWIPCVFYHQVSIDDLQKMKNQFF
jgi:hypothetical protein